MDGRNNKGGAEEEKKEATEDGIKQKEDNPSISSRTKGPPGFLFDQPKQRKIRSKPANSIFYNEIYLAFCNFANLS